MTFVELLITCLSLLNSNDHFHTLLRQKTKCFEHLFFVFGGVCGAALRFELRVSLLAKSPLKARWFEIVSCVSCKHFHMDFRKLG
jgi:hypothetical protein